MIFFQQWSGNLLSRKRNYSVPDLDRLAATPNRGCLALGPISGVP